MRITRQAKCKNCKKVVTYAHSEKDGVYNADLTETALWDDYREGFILMKLISKNVNLYYYRTLLEINIRSHLRPVM